LGESDFKAREKEAEEDKRKEEELEDKIRDIKKKRNRERYLKKGRRPGRKKAKLDNEATPPENATEIVRIPEEESDKKAEKRKSEVDKNAQEHTQGRHKRLRQIDIRKFCNDDLQTPEADLGCDNDEAYMPQKSIPTMTYLAQEGIKLAVTIKCCQPCQPCQYQKKPTVKKEESKPSCDIPVKKIVKITKVNQAVTIKYCSLVSRLLNQQILIFHLVRSIKLSTSQFQ
jgi:hypothetical protein